MSPLRRRSSRLRSSSDTPYSNTSSSRRLSRLAEREECFQDAQPALESIEETATAPQTPATARTKPAFQDMDLGRNYSASTPKFDNRHEKTPSTTGRIKPSFEEMHSGKGHSAASPSFDLRFTRSTAQLGPEAQKMMDEFREEALHIKAKLTVEREEEKRIQREAAVTSCGRKIALPKGKVGRFSDIHIAEFKKMDSIAGHASAYRAQPGRFPPATVPATKSLKRSQSNAKLDKREEVEKAITKPTLKAVKKTESEDGTPAKRARIVKEQDVTAAITEPHIPKKLSRSRSILASLTTPTQASLARAHATYVSAQSNSPSKPSLDTRGMIKSATAGNLSALQRPQPCQSVNQTPSRLERMKSLLCRPMEGPGKPSCTIPTAKSLSKSNLHKELPPIPTTPSVSKMSNINFTPRTLSKIAATVQASPSPHKSAIPRSKSNMNLGSSVHYPSLPCIMDEPTEEVTYPNLTRTSPLLKVSQKSEESVKPPIASVPGTFTFRCDKTISFGTSPHGFGGSPGQSSVRQVRPSIIPCSMQDIFRANPRDHNKENVSDALSISHGILNKKRRRVDYDVDEIEKEEPERSSKKHKGPTGIESPQKVAASATKLAIEKEEIAPKSRIPSPTKRGVLSLSRLNRLARPKMRK